jgi:hypothetical protein
MKTSDYGIVGTTPQELPVAQTHLLRRSFCRTSAQRERKGLRWTLLLCVSLFSLITCSVEAQIQQAWVARYDNGVPYGVDQSFRVNQAFISALDYGGNIHISGISLNSNLDYDYVTIKYAPNGAAVWITRCDSTNYPDAKPSAMILDASNNVILTGSGATIKLDSNGNQLWTAPYAGTALAVDNQGNIYVVGFSTNFGTVKLSPQGSNLWSQTYVESYGPTVSQSVVVDGGGNSYVSGLDTYTKIEESGVGEVPLVMLTTIKYGPNGNQLWKASKQPFYEAGSVQVAGVGLDATSNLYLVSNWKNLEGYYTLKYNSFGILVWATYPGGAQAAGLAFDPKSNVLLTGESETFKLNSDGSTAWGTAYPNPPSASSAGTSIAVDSAGNSYVTGFSPGTNSFNDIVTIKYDPNGNQVWLQRYNAYNVGDAEGNAIAVDKNGNVYVTGYETLPGGGTGIVTIKYSPVVLQRRSDGAFILQAQGSPGESFAIEASEDLQSWLGIGNATADSNGLAQFTDTNAPAYPARFYLANPQ